MFYKIRRACVLAFLLLGILTISFLTLAQTPPANGPVMRFTATSAGVSGAPDSIRFDLLAWSSDADRDQLVGAWNLTNLPAPARGGAPAGRGGGAGGGGGRGGGAGRGGGGTDAAAPAANAPEAAAGGAAAAGAGAGGGGGRGGGGGGRGGGGRGGGGAAPAADAVRPTPEAALAAALQAGKTVGYLWSSESAGYSLRYAYRVKQPDGGERIIIATERRLGSWNNSWKPAGNASAPEYEFSVIELRLNAKGLGEGKASITGKVAIDSSVNSIALDNYAASPVIFKDVKRLP